MNLYNPSTETNLGYTQPLSMFIPVFRGYRIRGVTGPLANLTANISDLYMTNRC